MSDIGGYDPSDPKSPGYRERAFESGDDYRERMKYEPQPEPEEES